MTGKELFREIGMIKEEYIEEAKDYKRSFIYNAAFRRSIAGAACLVICVGLYFGVQYIGGGGSNDCTTSTQSTNQTTTGESAMDSDSMKEQSGGSGNFATNDSVATENEGIQMETDASSSTTQDAEPEQSLSAVQEHLQNYPRDLGELCQTDAYVILHQRVKSGQQSWDSFVEKVEAGESATVDIVEFTIEGDPIITYLNYDGVDYYVVVDKTRDSYAGAYAEFRGLTYAYMNILEEDSYVEVYLSQEADLTREELVSGEYDVYSLFQYLVQE